MKGFLYTSITLVGTLLPLFAQQDDDTARGVARVSVIAGEVSIQRGDSGDNVAATLNAPLVAQDRVLTGPGARAEVQFDFANMVRLGANTEVRLAELQYQRFQVNVPVGLITFRVWQNSQSEVDINTPVASVRPMRRGEYRVQVLEDGSTEISVRDGEVDIFTPEGSRRLGGGRSLTIRREVTGQTSFLDAAPAPVDSWDQWNRNRDRELSASRSNQYLPQGVFGGEQLDAHGDWVYSAPYGNVWRPRVAAGWAPYRAGRWSWLDWYGWSWVSYDPWGWAPYHYGRWFMNAGSWCWWPGARGPRHFWSPALVSFVGFGRGIGVGFGWGNVGWVPLAPFETYNRWWGRGFYGNRGFNNVTVVNNVNITNIYRNARVNGGVSYVDAQNFNRGSAYAGGGVRAAQAADLANASQFRGPVGIAPNRESVRFAANDSGVRGQNAASQGREDMRFTARREAASLERVPFDQQRQNVEQMARGAGMVRGEDSGVRGSNGFDSSDRGTANSAGVRGAGSDGFVQREGTRGSGTANSDGFRRVGGDTAGVRGAGSDGFVQREGTRGSGTANSDGFRRVGGDTAGVRGAGSDVFVQREGTRGSGVGASGNDRSGWQRFGETGVNSGGVRGSRNNDGFVQRDRGTSSPSGRSGSVGSVDVSPRIVERGSSRSSGGSVRQQGGSMDSYGGGMRRGSEGGSGWGSFGGIRGGGGSSPSYSSGGMRGGGGGGGGSSPRMSSPSGGGGMGGGSMGGVRGGGGGGSRGGGAAPAGGAGGGSRSGGRGGNQ